MRGEGKNLLVGRDTHSSASAPTRDALIERAATGDARALNTCLRRAHQEEELLEVITPIVEKKALGGEQPFAEELDAVRACVEKCSREKQDLDFTIAYTRAHFLALPNLPEDERGEKFLKYFTSLLASNADGIGEEREDALFVPMRHLRHSTKTALYLSEQILKRATGPYSPDPWRQRFATASAPSGNWSVWKEEFMELFFQGDGFKAKVKEAVSGVQIKPGHLSIAIDVCTLNRTLCKDKLTEIIGNTLQASVAQRAAECLLEDAGSVKASQERILSWIDSSQEANRDFITLAHAIEEAGHPQSQESFTQARKRIAHSLEDLLSSDSGSDPGQ